MNRSLLALALLAGSAASLSAQSVTRLADSTVIAASAPRQWIVSSIPQGWRDSVARAWIDNFTGTTFRPAQPLIPEMRAELALQLMRNGDLRRVKLLKSSGDLSFDSVLIATTWAADRALAFPKFTHQMEGAGTEVTLEVWRPIAVRNASAAWDLAAMEIPPMTAECDSILRRPTGYSPMTLRARLDSVAGDEGRRAWAARALTAMQPEFHPTRVFEPNYRTRIIFSENAYTRTAEVRVSAILRFEVDSTGHLTAAEMVIPTDYPGLDTALIAMVRAADSSGAIPPPPPGAATNSVDVVLNSDRGATQIGVPLGIAQLGIWSVDNLPVLTKPGPINYPARLRSAQVSGRVTMDFLVGPAGDPVPGSVRIVASAHPDFSAASAQLIYGSKFRPATARGCAVTVAVRQSVNFRP